MSELRSYLRGWMGYFGLAAQLKLFDRLDQWIRRRHSDVLLEALAPSAHAPTGTHPPRRTAPTSDPPRPESQRPLAHGQNHRQWRRTDQRLACKLKDSLASSTLWAHLAPLRRTA